MGRVAVDHDVACLDLVATAPDHTLHDLFTLVFGNGRTDVLVQTPFRRIGVLAERVLNVNAKAFQFLFNDQLLGQVAR
jgi:hypothetical protein